MVAGVEAGSVDINRGGLVGQVWVQCGRCVWLECRGERERAGVWVMVLWERRDFLASWIVKVWLYLTLFPKQSCQVWPWRGQTYHNWAALLRFHSLVKVLLHQRLM